MPARLRLVDSKLARIFKGILESWKSAENAERFAKSGGQKIRGFGVYQTRINHDSPLREINGPSIPALNAPSRSAAAIHKRLAPRPESAVRFPRPRWGEAGIEAENGDARSAYNR